MEQESELMTLADAARLLNTTRQNLSLLVKKGQIPAQRVGETVVLVKRSDVEAYQQRPHRGRGRPLDPSSPRSKAHQQKPPETNE